MEDLLRVRDLRFHLYRRVIEINDGRLALRPFMDPVVAAEAITAARGTGLGAEQLTAGVEAFCLDAAAREKADDAPVRLEDSADVLRQKSDDFAGEVRWLVEVARHRRRESPAQQHRSESAEFAKPPTLVP